MDGPQLCAKKVKSVYAKPGPEKPIQLRGPSLERAQRAEQKVQSAQSIIEYSKEFCIPSLPLSSPAPVINQKQCGSLSLRSQV